MLCLSALFVSSFGFIGSEKPHWGNGELRYLLIPIFLPVLYALKTCSPPQISEEFDQHLTEHLDSFTSCRVELSLVHLQVLRWIKAYWYFARHSSTHLEGAASWALRYTPCKPSNNEELIITQPIETSPSSIPARKKRKNTRTIAAVRTEKFLQFDMNYWIHIL